MPTYTIRASDGSIVATGLASWAIAARLADGLTLRTHDLHTVQPETRN